MNKKIFRKLVIVGVVLFICSAGLFAGQNNQYNYNSDTDFSNKGDGNNIAVVNNIDGEIQMAELGSSEPSWTQSSETLYEVLSQQKSLIYKNKVYILGGYNGTYYSLNAQYWSLGVNGTFTSSRTTLTSKLPAKGGFAAVADNGYLYIMGGIDKTDVSGTPAPIAGVWRATIESSGSIGSFIYLAEPPYSTPLPVALKDHSAFIYKNYVYVYGGVTNAEGTLVNTKIYSSKIKIDGTLAGWTETAIAPDIQKKNAAIAVNGRYLYIAGGYKDSATVRTVHSIDMEDFSNSVTNPRVLNDLPEEREKNAIIIDRGQVYVLGGEKDGTPKNTVYTAQLSDDGSIAAWMTADTTFPSTIKDQSVVSYKGYVYSFGGHNGSSPVNNIQIGNITGLSEGISLFSTVGISTLPNATYGHNVVTTANNIYVLGGYGAGSYSNKIYMATQNVSNGSLSLWQQSSLDLPIPMAYFATLINGDKLYVFGGVNSAGDKVTGNYMTTINATTGQLASTWTEVAAYSIGRRYHSVVATQNLVYTIGGQTTGASYSGDVLVGQIDEGGMINSWVATKSITGVQQHKTVIIDDYILVIGGQYSNGIRADIQTITIGSNGGLVGNWSNSAISGLNTAIRDFSAVVKDEYVYVLGGDNGSTAITNVSYIKKEISGFGSWQNNPVNLPSARSKVGASLIGSYLYVIGGSDTNGDAQTSVYKANLSAGTRYS
ncbi:MAG: hypothetical protein ABIH39_03100, partial [Candidatus Margulisiibacteriota bacterium]